MRTQKFDITGMLEAKSFILATKLGDLTIKVEDITHIRWLSGCVTKKLSLAATDGLKDWCDTGVDVIRGDSIGFQCTGEINLFGSCNTGPTGTTNWNGRPYLVGAMIGRVGDSGIPFLIGPGRRVQASGSDRLYVKMYCPEDFFNGDNLNRSSGSFEIHVATGRSAEDMIVPDSGE